jgi:mono/diheme cytochrome c family protein
MKGSEHICLRRASGSRVDSHMRIALVIPVFLATASAVTIPAIDSARGEKVFHAQGCADCHGAGGTGGKFAPNLGATIDRNFTPPLMAATMWNHAPAMWSAMSQRGTPIPQLGEQEAGDLFAFFYSSRFFDKAGDAARGKRIFSVKHCADCHGLTTPGSGGALPVSQWPSLQSSIALAEGMWNHVGQMKERFAQRNLPWQQLTSHEMADIFVYARNLPANRGQKTSFELASGDRGAEIFAEKGCGGCHKGDLALDSRLKEKTILEIAVAMWNHAPQMSPGTAQRFEPGEMGQLLSYLWARPYFAGVGDAKRGHKVFVAKGCGSCHLDPASGAPDLNKFKGNFNSIAIVSALWRHGPTMLNRMKQKNIAWPRFDGREMSDVIAYLNH